MWFSKTGLDMFRLVLCPSYQGHPSISPKGHVCCCDSIGWIGAIGQAANMECLTSLIAQVTKPSTRKEPRLPEIAGVHLLPEGRVFEKPQIEYACACSLAACWL